MTDANVYLRRISLAGLTEAKPAGVAVLDTWDQVSDVAEGLGLSKAIQLFARPSATRDNGVNAGEVVWYGTQAGAINSLGNVSAGKRDVVMAELTRGMVGLQPLLDHPQIGPLFAAWLNIPSLEDDVLLVNDQVVITNWGLLPAAVAGSASQRRGHYSAGIGRLLSPESPTPPFEAGEGRIAVAPSAPRAAATETSNVGETARNPVLQSRDGVAMTAAPEVIVERAHRPWLAVAIATAVAALLLLILLIPGVLIYPAGDAVARAPLDPDLVAQTRTTLEAKARDLQALVRQGVCVAPPAGRTEANPANVPASPNAPGSSAVPGSPNAPGSPAAPNAPGPRSSPATPPLLQPSPASLSGPGSPNAQPSNLISHLDGVTALVLAPSVSGSGVAVGTGFFINDRHVVTNRHVVHDGDPARIFVINKARGRALTGRIVGETRSSEIGSDDFAIIEVPPEQGRPVMALTTTVSRGDSVIAAGFPSFVMSSDEGFQRVLANDLSAIPDPAVTQGWVTALQTSQSGQGLLVHGATISPGNSGGPLSDLCGRTVGVNTFGRIDTENALRLNFALRTQGLQRFLTEKQIPFKSDDAPCDPARTRAAAAPTPPASGPAQAPATAPPSGPLPAPAAVRPADPDKPQ